MRATMTKKVKAETDISTEEKIKEAARKVFTQKGYSATRTRDIAEEAGINLALLNYYFRSKEKLFEIIMMEKMQKFFGVLALIVNDPSTVLENKIESIAAGYTDMIMANPDLPMFILSEVRNSPDHFARIIEKRKLIQESVFISQIQERQPGTNPLQFLVSLLGMCVFPFVMKPVLQKMTNLDEETFNEMMLARKKLIPAWAEAILEAK
jgi:AcrR family transcriptional regulator